MHATMAKVSSKNQIVIPKEIRDALHIKGGDSILFIIWDGEVTLQSRPRSFTEAMRGLHADVWDDVEIDRWIKEERQTWE
jgi:AbrB family looped-hinge helix DNA binding protein